MSILDVNELVNNDELIPPIEKIREWLNENALRGYLDNTWDSRGRKVTAHYDDKKMNMYFAVYCINIIHIDGQFPIFVPQALVGCMHTIDMENFHSHKPLYIKKGVDIPYFIKKASETFYKIEII